AVEFDTGRQAIRANQARVYGQSERGVGEPRMRPDFALPITTALERLCVRRFQRSIVFVDRVRAGGRRAPFAIEPLRDGLQVPLVAAVIAQEHDVAKAVQLETARRVLERL